MSDSDTTRETVPTTTYLPDHLLAGGQAGILTVRAVDDRTDENGDDAADGEDGDTGSDPTAEFCRSWRRHRSGSQSFPF
ncbi:hypothetical protein [Halorientalis regularis]|jgi:hypothetical protein|uniref:Uncharacterized protein n=1 Tax=Halorientalis regularis TaxID=660518 RepID=A0A1G7KTH3_9EURY|nr:hypothetical protein [Halorientalis regularis]SDF40538.1 hypothetical protein SAMN05216218_10626 [Halorientalis regularis]